MCTWQTVAQTAKANNIVIMIGDFNSALKPTQGGGYGVHGSLKPFLDKTQMCSTHQRMFATQPDTYYQGDEPISAIDHILISECQENLITQAVIDTGGHTIPMSAHKPIGIQVSLALLSGVEPHLQLNHRYQSN